MKTKNRLLRLSLIFCLVLGWTATVPMASSGTVLADNPPPPTEEENQAIILAPPLPPAPTGAQAELYAGLAALEQAQRQGPEAVLALTQTLRGEALDLAMRDIVEAQRQLALAAPPRPVTAPVSLEEEEALQQSQVALDAVSHARALAQYTEVLEDQAPDDASQATTAHNAPNVPSVDRTVGSAPCTYSSIAAAMSAANDGDRLLLEGGVSFPGSLSVHKSLTFQGGYAGCGSGSSDLTTIDSGGTGRGMYIYDNLTITLENLNVINANTGGYGAGIFVYTNTHLMGTNLNIYSNTTAGLGGGVFLWGARATFTDTDIYNNVADAGAGVYGVLRGSYVPALNLPSYADVYDNDALTGSGYGGGVYMGEGTVSIADCSDIYSNNAIAGGGAYLITSTLTIAGDCSEIMFNTATGNGGGVYAVDSTINLDLDAELYSNTAGTSGTGNGGGAYLDNSDLSGDKALIYYNTAEDYGGGGYATNGSLLDMDLGGYPCAGPRCSQLSYNTAGLYGGGVYAFDGSEVDLRQIFVEGNSGSMGGGVYVYQSPVYLYNTLVARNDATGGTGDGLRLYTGASLTGAHNTLAHNNAAGATTGNAIGMTGATLSLSNSVIWGHATSVSDAAQTITYSDVQGGYAGTGNMNVDPLFINPGVANFHLQSSSPVIDRCATGQLYDFDNEARPVTYVRPATPYDMGADEASARVGINGAGCAYGRIQDAVDAAASGATIQVASDVFSETVDVTKTLTIAGGYDVDCTAYITGTTTVNASDSSPADSVFDVSNSTLTLRNLAITGGNASNGGGLGVLNSSQVTLDNTDVFGNQAGNGGGAYISGNCVLTLTNDSDISNNVATLNGGGARVWGKLVGDDWASKISDNTAPNGGGVSVPEGTLELLGSHVMNNDATDVAGRGGGIHVYNSGVITATSSSNVSNNSAYDGAGIYADNAKVYLPHAIIHGNTAANNGGGVYLANNSYLSAATAAYIGYPLVSGGDNEAVNGAGLYIDASTLNFSGKVVNNGASNSGGGVCANASVINLTGAQVGGVDANQPNQLSNSGYGAGLFLSGTHASLVNTVVVSNTFPAASAWGYGGGLHLQNGSVVTLTGSTVERHLAPTSSARGAGLYVLDSTVTLSNSQVLSNTSEGTGGGVRLYGNSTLNVINGSVLRDNQALAGNGGAVAATGTPDINISDSTLEDNSASGDGGAVYLDAGTLDFTNGWTLRENTAGGNGGAVAVINTADADFNAGGYSLVYYNRATGGHGGMVYLGNNTTSELHATSGSQMYVYANSAGGNGGVLYADGGGFFDVYGQVDFDRNRADNGGAIYLTGGSRVWLDDYIHIAPRLWDNWADSGSGGVIYAQDSPRVECDGAVFGDDADGNHAIVGSGGAFYLSGSTFNADNCIFRDNQATESGGAIAAYTSTLNIYATYPVLTLAVQPSHIEREQLNTTAPTATSCDPLTEQCSAFHGNVADSDANATGDGGAIYVNGSTLHVDHTYLYRNSARAGGAIYQTGAGAIGEVANSLVYSNTVSVALGAGIRRSGGAFTVTHVTLANNVGGSGFSGVASAAYNTIAWGNTTGGFTITPTFAMCNIDDAGYAGVNLDPQFVASGAGENYRLRGVSPAIDACATGLPIDLDNKARPIDSQYDMGAYEGPGEIYIFLPLVLRNYTN